MDAPVMLNVRGTHSQKNLDAARALHNATAGSPGGMEAARSMSDMSHCVYVPAKGAAAVSSAKDGELLFIDFWADAAGLQKFFSNPDVVEQGAKLFSAKDPSVWMPARGAFTFHVPPVAAKRPGVVGLLRARVTTPEAAVEAFNAVTHKGLAAARRRGLLSHELYVKLGPPNEPMEIVGVDLWSSVEGRVEHYSDRSGLAPLSAGFAGEPAASVWEQAGGFNEW